MPINEFPILKRLHRLRISKLPGGGGWGGGGGGGGGVGGGGGRDCLVFAPQISESLLTLRSLREVPIRVTSNRHVDYQRRRGTLIRLAPMS